MGDDAHQAIGVASMLVSVRVAPQAWVGKTTQLHKMYLLKPPQLDLGRTPKGSCNRTLLRRVLRRFSTSRCFLEGS